MSDLERDLDISSSAVHWFGASGTLGGTRASRDSKGRGRGFEKGGGTRATRESPVNGDRLFVCRTHKCTHITHIAQMHTHHFSLSLFFLSLCVFLSLVRTFARVHSRSRARSLACTLARTLHLTPFCLPIVHRICCLSNNPPLFFFSDMKNQRATRGQHLTQTPNPSPRNSNP